MRDYKHEIDVNLRAVRRFLPQVQVSSHNPGDGRRFALEVPDGAGVRRLTGTAIGRPEFLTMVSAVADVLAHLEATGRLRSEEILPS